jgi:predicted amidophosphoribosyltransferase
MPSIFDWFRLCCRRRLTAKIGVCRSCGEPTRRNELCPLCDAERVVGRLSGTDDELLGL